jgi:hypothetical protein
MTGYSGKESHTKVKDGNLPMIEVICQRYAQIKIIAYYCNSSGLLMMRPATKGLFENAPHLLNGSARHGVWQCLEIIARGLDEAVARLRLHVEDT